MGPSGSNWVLIMLRFGLTLPLFPTQPKIFNLRHTSCQGRLNLPRQSLQSIDVDMEEDSQISQQQETKTEVSDLDYVTCREIGREAVWSLSSAKPGNGVDQLRDESIETYWQSDGGQPHLINIQFHKKMTVVEIAFYLDFSLDESYTPKKLSIRAGSSFHDLVEVTMKELHEPIGWVRVPLNAPTSSGAATPVTTDDTSGVAERPALRAHFVQICVVAMHQNGRDTHIRQVKVFGPRLASVQHDPSLLEFISPEFEHFACIR